MTPKLDYIVNGLAKTLQAKEERRLEIKDEIISIEQAIFHLIDEHILNSEAVEFKTYINPQTNMIDGVYHVINKKYDIKLSLNLSEDKVVVLVNNTFYGLLKDVETVLLCKKVILEQECYLNL